MLFDMPQKDKSIIKVLGVGGGGGNALSHMFEQGIKGVDFAVCNTDNQALENNPVITKIKLGPALTDGRGAGSKPEIGKQACIESIDEVRKFLSDDTKMLFITAGMGGGTGTGAAPIIAKAAKEMEILTVAIVTLPFKFEGLRRKRQALEGLEQLKKNVDSILVISNEKVKEIHGNLKVSEAFAEADGVLTTAAKGIAEIITVAGEINVDFEDVNTVMRDSGVAIMGSAQMEGEDRARRAIDAALNSPLLEDNDIRGAKHILLNISSSSSDEVTMDEIAEITEYVQEEAGYGTDLFWGNCLDESLGAKVSVTLIATGFDKNASKPLPPKQEEKKTIVPLEDHQDRKSSTNAFDPSHYNNQNEESQVIDFEQDDVRQTVENLGYSYDVFNAEKPQMTDYEREMEAIKNKRREAENARRGFLRDKMSKHLDSPKMINDMENVPAYKRRNVELEEGAQEEGNQKSAYMVNMDDDGPIISRSNSYLHDNVD